MTHWPALLGVLSAGCASPEAPPDATLTERTWSSERADLALRFPQGWALVMDPALFRAELPATLLEASFGELRVALTFTALSPLVLDGASSLDLLHELSPSVRTASDPSYRMERLPSCNGAVRRELQGHTWLGLKTDTGLAILHAWGADTTAAVALICGAG